jgi:hypothetical protein
MRLLRLRYAVFASLTVFVAGVCCASASPGRDTPTASDGGAFLHFGQSLALADFDGDDRIDTATLSSTGRNKDIEIRLSRAKSRIVLRFDTQTSELGSLFSRDVDNDGDNDLIWSNLLRADDVVIWLDDGSGRFDRVPSDEYANIFVLSNAPACGGSEIPRADYALGSRYDPSSALLLAQKTEWPARTPIFRAEWGSVPIHTGILSTPFDRGPP